MNLKIFIFTIFTSITIFASEKIVFNTFPENRDSQALKSEEAAKYGILIKKVKSKYIWSSREDKELKYHQSGIFHVFTALDGSGIISIVDNSIVDPKNKNINYGEHIRNGINIISYTGNAKFISP